MVHAGVFSHERPEGATVRSESDRMEMSTTMKTLMNASVIPLAHAVLCLDCNCVTNGNRECPACSSRAQMNLSSVLNRQTMCCYSLKRAA